jgi:hypothetical protein
MMGKRVNEIRRKRDNGRMDGREDGIIGRRVNEIIRKRNN